MIDQDFCFGVLDWISTHKVFDDMMFGSEV